jgi:hypothetical protein
VDNPAREAEYRAELQARREKLRAEAAAILPPKPTRLARASGSTWSSTG